MLESAEVAQLLETGCAKKGGKHKQIAVHHVLEGYLDAYLAAAGLGEHKGTALLRTARGKTGALTAGRMSQSAVRGPPIPSHPIP